MQRRQFVGSGLALAATWPLRGFTSVLKGVGDVPARSLDGGETVLPGSAIETLAASLRGEVLLASSQDYDRTRRVWNASFDKKPALIARCTGASDVQQAVAFAREHQHGVPQSRHAFHAWRTQHLAEQGRHRRKHGEDARELARTGAADQGLLHELRGFRRHDGGLSRQLRR